MTKKKKEPTKKSPDKIRYLTGENPEDAFHPIFGEGLKMHFGGSLQGLIPSMPSCPEDEDQSHVEEDKNPPETEKVRNRRGEDLKDD